MATEISNQKIKRRRYRTRMFDNRFSFPTTSEQVRQLQAESDAQGRSVASLIREAIDEFLPRLRGRRRKRQRTPDALPVRRKRRTPLESPAAAPKAEDRLQRAVRRLLGDPQKQEMVLTKTDPPGQTVKWFYGPKRCAGNRFSEREMARPGKEKRRQHPGTGDAGKAARPDRGIRLDKGTGTSAGPASNDE